MFISYPLRAPIVTISTNLKYKTLADRLLKLMTKYTNIYKIKLTLCWVIQFNITIVVMIKLFLFQTACEYVGRNICFDYFITRIEVMYFFDKFSHGDRWNVNNYENWYRKNSLKYIISTRNDNEKHKANRRFSYLYCR